MLVRTLTPDALILDERYAGRARSPHILPKDGAKAFWRYPATGSGYPAAASSRFVWLYVRLKK